MLVFGLHAFLLFLFLFFFFKYDLIYFFPYKLELRLGKLMHL